MSTKLRLIPFPFLLVGAIVVASLAPSCSDPVHDAQVASLGPEFPGIPQGEYHRAGQPCTWCHGPEGPAKTQFSLAGTVFWQGGIDGYTNTFVGVNQAVIAVVDSNGVQNEFTTNCVGNFFVAPSVFTPSFPILAGVYGPDGSTQSMPSQIGRAGSCAECHFDPPNYNSPGHIFLTNGPLSSNAAAVQAENTECPVDPNLADETVGGGVGGVVQ